MTHTRDEGRTELREKVLSCMELCQTSLCHVGERCAYCRGAADEIIDIVQNRTPTSDTENVGEEDVLVHEVVRRLKSAESWLAQEDMDMSRAEARVEVTFALEALARLRRTPETEALPHGPLVDILLRLKQGQIGVLSAEDEIRALATQDPNAGGSG